MTLTPEITEGTYVRIAGSKKKWRVQKTTAHYLKVITGTAFEVQKKWVGRSEAKVWS